MVVHYRICFADTRNRIRDVVHRQLARRNILRVPDGEIQYLRHDNIVSIYFCDIHFLGTI